MTHIQCKPESENAVTIVIRLKKLVKSHLFWFGLSFNYFNFSLICVLYFLGFEFYLFILFGFEI